MAFSTVSCQTEIEGTNYDSIVAEITADPMHKAYVENHQEVQQMIIQGAIDMESGYKIAASTPRFEFCNPPEELMEVRGYDFYAPAMCRHVTYVKDLKEKYPVIDQLPDKYKREVMSTAKWYSDDEVEDLTKDRIGNR